MPALAKTKSIWPWASIAVLNSLVSAVHCVTSVWTKVEEPGAGGGLISALTIFAPRELRSSTVARPMPEEQPVMVSLDSQIETCEELENTCDDHDFALELGPGEVCVCDLELCHICFS
jgi:hypothetical protein